MKEFPKFLFRLTEMIFILPNEFNGNVADALRLVADYIEEKGSKTIDESNVVSIEKLLMNDEARLCAEFGIFERDDNTGNYILK